GDDRLAQVRRRLDLTEVHEELYPVPGSRAEVLAFHPLLDRREVAEPGELQERLRRIWRLREIVAREELARVGALAHDVEASIDGRHDRVDASRDERCLTV